MWRRIPPIVRAVDLGRAEIQMGVLQHRDAAQQVPVDHRPVIEVLGSVHRSASVRVIQRSNPAGG